MKIAYYDQKSNSRKITDVVDASALEGRMKDAGLGLQGFNKCRQDGSDMEYD